jgi:hypothetical protein
MKTIDALCEKANKFILNGLVTVLISVRKHHNVEAFLEFGGKSSS